MSARRPLALASVLLAAVASVTVGTGSARAVTPADLDPNITLSSTASLPDVRYGEDGERITVTVSESGRPVTSGSVRFSDGADHDLGTVAVNARGQAGLSFPTHSLGLGVHSVFFTHLDGLGEVDAVGGETAFTVVKNTPTITLFPRGLPRVSHLGHFRYRVHVTAPHTVPTGTIRFTLGRRTVGTGTLSHGWVTVTLARLPRGLRSLNLRYSGNAVLNSQIRTNILIRVV